MDTRQLAAFCAVVERKSFSQAAERLGVTQPAVTLQVRALEKRLGTQLLDRSGRRVEPTEAGRRLYRGAQRMLALEEQLLEEVAAPARARWRAISCSARRPARRRSSFRSLLCEFQRAEPRRARVPHGLRHADGRRARRGARARARDRRRRAAAPRRAFEPFFRDEVILVCPPGHSLRRPDGDARRAAGGAADRDAGGRRRPPDGRGRAAARRASGCATSTSGSSSACRSRCGARSRPATA